MTDVARVTDVGRTARHPGWVRVSHCILAASVPTLVFSGIMILMVHPRLYWGEAGNDLTPAREELAPAAFSRDVSDHVRLRTAMSDGPSPYGLLQKAAYTLVVFALVPLVIASGLAMSPAVTAAVPWLVAAFRRIVVTDEFEDGGKSGSIQNGWAWYTGI